LTVSRGIVAALNRSRGKIKPPDDGP